MSVLGLCLFFMGMVFLILAVKAASRGGSSTDELSLDELNELRSLHQKNIQDQSRIFHD
jgi:hypothetical protein